MTIIDNKESTPEDVAQSLQNISLQQTSNTGAPSSHDTYAEEPTEAPPGYSLHATPDTSSHLRDEKGFLKEQPETTSRDVAPSSSQPPEFPQPSPSYSPPQPPYEYARMPSQPFQNTTPSSSERALPPPSAGMSGPSSTRNTIHGAPPPSFSRPRGQAPFGPFPILFLYSSDKQLHDGFPVVLPDVTVPVPIHPFATHDVMEQDWRRFIEDIGTSALPNGSQKVVAGVAPVIKHIGFAGMMLSKTLERNLGTQTSKPIGELIAIWNEHFFHPRGMQVLLAQGPKILNGSVDSVAPDWNHHGHSRRSSCSSSSFSSSSSSDSDCRGGRLGLGGGILADRAGRKEERRRLRAERRQARRERKRERRDERIERREDRKRDRYERKASRKLKDRFRLVITPFP